MENNNIGKFIDEVIIKAGYDKMPEDFLSEYKEKLTEEAHKRLGITAIEALPEDKTEEFSKLAEENPNDFDAINKYLKENITDFDQKMAEALSEFGREVVESAEKLKKN